MNKTIYYLTISHQYGKSRAGLLEAVQNGLFAIRPSFDGVERVARLNDGKTCYLKPTAKTPLYLAQAVRAYYAAHK